MPTINLNIGEMLDYPWTGTLSITLETGILDNPPGVVPAGWITNVAITNGVGTIELLPSDFYNSSYRATFATPADPDVAGVRRVWFTRFDVPQSIESVNLSDLTTFITIDPDKWTNDIQCLVDGLLLDPDFLDLLGRIIDSQLPELGGGGGGGGGVTTFNGRAGDVTLLLSDLPAGLLTDSDLADHVDNYGNGFHIPIAGIADANVATNAAIAWSKISKAGASPADVGAASSVHSHVAANITDFAQASFDRLVASLLAGSNITLTPNSGARTITISSTGGGGTAGVTSFNTRTGAVTLLESDIPAGITRDTELEAHADLIGLGAHIPFSGITNTHVATSAGIAWSKISKSGATAGDVGAAAISHTHLTTAITDFVQEVYDRIVATLLQGSGITLTPNAGARTLTINSTATGGVSSFNTRTGAVTLLESDIPAEITRDSELSAYRQIAVPVPSTDISLGSIRVFRPIVTVAGNKNLVLSDVATLQVWDSATSATLTIQPDASLNLAAAAEIDLVQINTGALILAAGAGVTVVRRGVGALQLAGAGAVAQIKKLSANRWLLAGDLV